MVLVPLTRFPTSCASLPMSSEKAVVQVYLLGPRMSWVHPWVFPVVGSSTTWKETDPSPMVSTVWLACARERRGYLWGGSLVGGSTLGGGSGGGIVGLLGGTAGGTLGGAWGLVLWCRLGSCTVLHVRLVGWGGLGGAPVAEKMPASCRMASMVWAPNWAKGAAGAEFARASARRQAASEDMENIFSYPILCPLCNLHQRKKTKTKLTELGIYFNVVRQVHIVVKKTRFLQNVDI